MKSYFRRTAAVAIVSLYIPLVIGACSGANQDDKPQPVDAAAITQEYIAETKSLTLPPGATFPAMKYSSDTIFEPGSGKVDADGAWWCAWSQHYLNSEGATQQEALTQLTGFTSMYAYKTAMDSDSKKSIDAILSSLKLGDPGPLRNDVASNCKKGS